MDRLKEKKTLALWEPSDGFASLLRSTNEDKLEKVLRSLVLGQEGLYRIFARYINYLLEQREVLIRTLDGQRWRITVVGEDLEIQKEVTGTWQMVARFKGG